MFQGHEVEWLLFIMACGAAIWLIYKILDWTVDWLMRLGRKPTKPGIFSSSEEVVLTDEQRARYRAEVLAELSRIQDSSATPAWYIGPKKMTTGEMIAEVTAGTELGRKVVELHAKLPQYTSPLYQKCKAELLADLRIKSGRNRKGIAYGGRNFSVNELIREIEEDTAIGREHVEMLIRAREHAVAV